MKRFSIVLALVVAAGAVMAQGGAAILTGADLTRVVPTGFYFQGLSAPTQMRNSAAARFGTDRYVISGLVDTSGYSADVRAKYVGFLITDSAITLNGESLPSGAYGFGPRRKRSTLGAGHERQGAATPAPIDDVFRSEWCSPIRRQRLRRHRC
jgi:hypothetical protein